MVIERLGATPQGARIARWADHLVSVIVPTRNEAGNIRVLAERVAASLSGAGFNWEVIFVDDSDDDTPRRIEALEDALRVTLLHRPLGRRPGGLSGAVVEGFLHARGDVLVVMDGDLQHPPEAVPLLGPVRARESLCDRRRFALRR